MSLFKRLIPKDKSDTFAVVLVTILILTIFGHDLRMVYKLYQEESEHHLTTKPSTNVLFNLLIGIFIFFNVLSNMLLAMITDTSIKSITSLPTILLPDWRYCSACEQNAPPRSFHCYNCETCILKRSNHCTFLGKCCGYKNARYYYYFIVFAWLGTLYSNLLNIEYIVELMHGFSVKTLFIIFMPLLAWLFGFLDNLAFFSAIANTACLFLSIILFLYLIINGKIAINGQTWFEYSTKNFDYSLGWKTNLIETFGNNWFFALIWPFSSYRLSSDGTKFKKLPKGFQKQSTKSI
jgi:palmitoyltransferase